MILQQSRSVWKQSQTKLQQSYIVWKLMKLSEFIIYIKGIDNVIQIAVTDHASAVLHSVKTDETDASYYDRLCFSFNNLTK